VYEWLQTGSWVVIELIVLFTYREYTLQCLAQIVFWVMVFAALLGSGSSSGRCPATGLISLQAGGQLTPAFYSSKISVSQSSRRSVSLGIKPRLSKSKLQYDRQSGGQSVSVSGTHLGPATKFSPSVFLYFRQLRVCWCGRPLWREDGSIICNAMTQV
jgi:hypothetical protein